jgi:uncharacterized protein (TIGR02284 family)
MKPTFYEHGGHGPGRSTRNKKILSILNDLIRINIDRITGYEKVSHEEVTEDTELRELFYHLATESRAAVNNLHAEVIKLDGAPVTQSTITGKIYLCWLDGRNTFEGADAALRLNACAAAELAIQKAYQQALDQEERLPDKLHDMVETQLWSLERAYDKLASLIHA